MTEKEICLLLTGIEDDIQHLQKKLYKAARTLLEEVNASIAPSVELGTILNNLHPMLDVYLSDLIFTCRRLPQVKIYFFVSSMGKPVSRAYAAIEVFGERVMPEVVFNEKASRVLYDLAKIVKKMPMLTNKDTAKELLAYDLKRAAETLEPPSKEGSGN